MGKSLDLFSDLLKQLELALRSILSQRVAMLRFGENESGDTGN